MDFSKLKNRLLIVLCVFIVLFPFWCVRGLCAEVEEVTYDVVSGIYITNNSNIFVSNSNQAVGYVLLEKGYIYYFHNNNVSTSRPIAFSDNVPVLNGTYNYIGSVEGNSTYTYRSDNSNTYLYFDFGSGTGANTFTVTREKIDSMDGAVSDLVNNVGVNSIWNIFDISINYIVIVVLVALGLFIIFRFIKKVSKGKEGF